jgi:hypothetical protein
MLKHLVFFKFHPDVSEDRIRDMETGLGALPGIIPEIKYYDFGRDVVRSERSFDFGLISHFDDRESLQRYAAHPEHQKVLDIIREISADIAAVDFYSNADS